MSGIRKAKTHLEINFTKGVTYFHRYVSQKRKTPLHTPLINETTDMEALRCSRTALPEFSLIIFFLLLSSSCMLREEQENEVASTIRDQAQDHLKT